MYIGAYGVIFPENSFITPLTPPILGGFQGDQPVAPTIDTHHGDPFLYFCVGYAPGYKVFLPSKMGISAHFITQSMGIIVGAIH
jgi:hypothetical protein